MSIESALREKLPVGEYALFFEVRNAAGFEASRSADAIAVNLWPSRGLEILGFEIKTARSDWLRELKNPAKAEAIFKFCDRWIILATPGVVKVEELPLGWGLWEWSAGDAPLAFDQTAAPRKEKLVGKVTPAKLEPVPLSRGFLAAILKRAGQVDVSLVNAAIQKQRKDELADFEKRVEAEVGRRTRKMQELEKTVSAFEQASGVKIESEWIMGNVGRAVKTLIALQSEDNVMRQAKYMRDRLNALIEDEPCS